MTKQASENIEYRGKSYLLYGCPLHQYLDENKGIKFKPFSTANWRGYQGYWILKNECIYLKDIESANYTLYDLFKTEEPVLAIWFSGIIQFGFGDYEDSKFTRSYQNYVWLKIEKGKVVEKKIRTCVKIEAEINFGKYKGKKIEDVISGKINSKSSQKLYIETIINFFLNNDFNYDIYFPYYKFSETDYDIVKSAKNQNIKYLVGNNFIALDMDFISDSNLLILEGFSKFLESILQSDFSNLLILKRKNSEQKIGISELTNLINPDLEYLSWALKTVDFFCISPIYLKRKYNLKKLKTFKTSRLSRFVFDYQPIIEDFEFIFSENTYIINLKKFEDLYNVKYDSDNDIYLHNLNDKDLKNAFGYFIEENYYYDDKLKDLNNYEGYL